MKICTNTGDSDSVTLSNGIAVMSIDFWRMASEAGELMWCGEACVEDLLGELDGDTICLQTGNIVNEKEGHRQIMSCQTNIFHTFLAPCYLAIFGNCLPYLAISCHSGCLVKPCPPGKGGRFNLGGKSLSWTQHLTRPKAQIRMRQESWEFRNSASSPQQPYLRRRDSICWDLLAWLKEIAWHSSRSMS